MSEHHVGGWISEPSDNDSIPVMLSRGFALHGLSHDALRQAAEADRTMNHAIALGLDEDTANEVVQAWARHFHATLDPWDWKRIRDAMTRRAFRQEWKPDQPAPSEEVVRMSENKTTPGTYLTWGLLLAGFGLVCLLGGGAEDSPPLAAVGLLILAASSILILIGAVGVGVKSGQHRQS